MSITINSYIDVRERAAELGLDTVGQFAILPRRFAESGPDELLLDEADAVTVRKLLNEAGLAIQQLRKDDQPLPSIVQRSADWVAPTLFVGSMFLSQNPHAIQVALGVIDSYVSDVLKGRLTRGTVKLTVVLERTPSQDYSKVDYEGPPSGLRDLAEVLKRMRDESV